MTNDVKQLPKSRRIEATQLALAWNLTIRLIYGPESQYTFTPPLVFQGNEKQEEKSAVLSRGDHRRLCVEMAAN